MHVQTPVRVERRPDDARAEVRGRHVARDGERVAARSLQSVGRLARRLLVYVREHDARAVRAEQLGARATDAARRAGDDGDFAFQQLHRVVGVLGAGCRVLG